MSTISARPVSCAAMLLFLTAANLLADTPTAPAKNLASGSMFLSLVRTIGALALVFACFGGGLWLFRNWQRFMIRSGPLPKLQVLEVKALGHRQALYLVAYEDQRLLLASAPGGVTMIATLPAGHETADPRLVPQTNFTNALCQALGRKP